MGTAYKIAENGADYRKAHALIKESGMDREFQLSFPTILAMENEEVVGVLGTNIEQDCILAGPLVLKQDKKRSFTILRLVELYDFTMRKAGIRSYLFCTELGNEKWLEYVERLGGLKPYSYKGGHAWFIRDLKEG